LFTEMPDLMDIVSGPSKVNAPSFDVTDLNSANWAMSKAAQAEKRIQQRSALASQYHEKIDAWLAEANKPDLQTVEFMQSLLGPWATRELATGKRKSLKLLGGTVGFRSSPPAVEVLDHDAALAYCKTFAPELVRIKEELDKKEIKKRLEGGEVIEGVQLSVGHVKFYLTVEDEDGEEAVYRRALAE
jgi:phage host-nuclease inhibitor protein Gam